MEETSKYIVYSSDAAEKIMNRLKNDIDYIPSFEEYLLVSNMDFCIDEIPLTLELVSHDDVSKLKELEKNTQNNRPGGMKELFYSLEMNKSCSSSSENRIYYLAYLLACEDILVNISGQEQRIKQFKKIKALQEYKNKSTKIEVSNNADR